jgi:TonB family protein
MTNSGLDSDPWLSPDGRTVVFIRRSPEDMLLTSVYKIEIPTQALSLLYSGPVSDNGREIRSFGRPELDESKGTLFLLASLYATEGSLFAVRLGTGESALISEHVVGYDIVECPAQNRGDLIVLKRSSDILGKPYFLSWLYTPSGKELGLAGAGELEEADIDMIREGKCPALPVHTLTKPPSPPLGDAIRVDEGAMALRLVTRVEPTYPREARSRYIQGDVRLEVRVATDGTVEDVNLVSGPQQLVAAAKAAVRQWRYRPGISSGHPVPVVTIVTVRFRLPQANR